MALDNDYTKPNNFPFNSPLLDMSTIAHFLQKWEDLGLVASHDTLGTEWGGDITSYIISMKLYFRCN